MKFGFILPNNWGVDDPKEVVDIAVKAESLGFNSVWVNHHVLHVGYVSDRLGERPYHDALTILTYVAAVTNRVRLGTSVLVLPYLNPIVLAKALATLDVLSDGRLTLGVGVGPLKEEFDNLGSDFAERGPYTSESIDIMKELWTSQTPVFEGKFHSFADVKFYPKPSQKPHPPIVVGGISNSALRRVAQRGNGWHPIRMTPDVFSERLEYLNRQLEAFGRAMSEIDLSIRLEFDVLDAAKPDNQDPMIGTPDELIETVRTYSELGVSEIVLATSTNDTKRIGAAMERFASEVMPRAN